MSNSPLLLYIFLDWNIIYLELLKVTRDFAHISKANINSQGLVDKYKYLQSLLHDMPSKVYRPWPSAVHIAFLLRLEFCSTFCAWLNKYGCFPLHKMQCSSPNAWLLCQRSEGIIWKGWTLQSPQHLPAHFQAFFWFPVRRMSRPNLGLPPQSSGSFFFGYRIKLNKKSLK